MSDPHPYERLLELGRPHGSASRTLVLGSLALHVSGIDRDLAERLDHRWRGFMREPPPSAERLVVRLYDAGDASWLPRWQPGEPYRIEAVGTADRRAVVSYYFALAEEAEGWRLGLSTTTAESEDRRVDNATRFIVAAWVLSRGGFAMHAAAVERAGRAYVLAGPSRAGKSTASKSMRGGQSLGDDFAIVRPDGAGWLAPALPFDNSETVTGRPASGEFAVEGIWKLVQDESDRVVSLPKARALASLVGCAAFPWALPDEADVLLANARRFVDTCQFAHLHFTRGADLGSLLSPPGGSPD